MTIKFCIRVAALAAVTGVGSLAVSTASASITIPTVPIGNPGNAADPSTGFGSVAYTYNIGATEVTNTQYAAFLNAVARADPNGLFNPLMTAYGDIARSGSPGSYAYVAFADRASHPVIAVSFWDAARFANWLHNGQPTGPQGAGTTEDGAYTLTPAGIAANTVTRNANWQWALPTEDEWYKAAYHQPASQGGDADGYWLYPTSSNVAPALEDANWGFANVGAVAVGSYAPNFYGTFDMGGNLFEWTNSIGGMFGPANRITRGGSFNDDDGLEATTRFGVPATIEEWDWGFRVVGAPEPAPCPCTTDYDQSGSEIPDIDDLVKFFDDFNDGSDAADVDCTGVGSIPDIDDIIRFFEIFAGGC